MRLITLHNALAKLGPIDGVAKTSADPRNWRVDIAPAATLEERIAIADFMANGDFQTLEDEDAVAAVRAARAKAYPPIGDQLDAIWKALNYLQMEGVIDLVSEADAILGRILNVKKQNPIPNSEEE